MNLRAKFSTTCFNQFCWDLIYTSNLFLSVFSITISNSKILGLGTSGSTVCICVLHITDGHVQVSDGFDLTASLNFINLKFPSFCS